MITNTNNGLQVGMGIFNVLGIVELEQNTQRFFVQEKGLSTEKGGQQKVVHLRRTSVLRR